MKISKIVFALALVSTVALTSCRDTKSKPESTEEHGHEHNVDGSHIQETIEQEEFQVGKDTMGTKTEEHGHDHDEEGNHSNDNDPETHKHDDGSEHHNH
jgi:hypothetical protein